MKKKTKNRFKEMAPHIPEYLCYDFLPFETDSYNETNIADNNVDFFDLDSIGINELNKDIENLEIIYQDNAIAQNNENIINDFDTEEIINIINELDNKVVQSNPNKNENEIIPDNAQISTNDVKFNVENYNDISQVYAPVMNGLISLRDIDGTIVQENSVVPKISEFSQINMNKKVVKSKKVKAIEEIKSRNKEPICFGNTTVEKGSEKYYELRQKNRTAVEKSRQKQKLIQNQKDEQIKKLENLVAQLINIMQEHGIQVEIK